MHSNFATQDLSEDTSADACSTVNLTAKLVQWVALRFAASAHTLAPVDDEPETDLRRPRQFAADIIALRRGDLNSRRLDLEEKHLDLLSKQTQEAREEEFWEWTKRDDIRDRLEDQFEERIEWEDTLRAIPEIAPWLPKRNSAPDECSCPAALI